MEVKLLFWLIFYLPLFRGGGRRASRAPPVISTEAEKSFQYDTLDLAPRWKDFSAPPRINPGLRSK